MSLSKYVRQSEGLHFPFDRLKAAWQFASTMGLDTVEIVMGCESAFGIEITDKEAEQSRTVRSVTDLICKKLNAVDASTAYCPGARAFYQLRRALITEAGIPRGAIKPEVKIATLFPGRDSDKSWANVGRQMGCTEWPRLYIGVTWLKPSPCRKNLRDFSFWLVTREPRLFMDANEPWSRQRVRYVIRAVISEVTGLKDYSDDADFIRDLRFD